MSRLITSDMIVFLKMTDTDDKTEERIFSI